MTVTLYCQVLKIGGMIHSLLPYPLSGGAVPCGQIGRFVNSSVRHVFERMIFLGARKGTIEVKIFGGGQLVGGLTGNPSDLEINIGRRNVETALNVTRELGLQVTATDVGGSLGRTLIFYPHRGDVWVKRSFAP